MKTCFIKSALAAILLTFSLSVSAQGYLDDPKWGATKEEREANALLWNFFKDTYNNQDYGTAVGYMQQLMEKAPKATQNLYIYGADIYKNKIMRAKSVAEKNVLLDSLMMIYDKRIENFGDHPTRGKGYILTFKAGDYLTFKPMDREGVRELFVEAIDQNGNDIDPDFLNAYFNELVADYKADLVETDHLLNEYDRLVIIFDADSTPEKSEAKRTFEALFVTSGAANCENIEKIYAPRVAANPTDTVTLGKAFALLSRGQCHSDFMINVAEKYYALKPSSDIALMIAGYCEEKKDYAKALKYLNEAVVSEKDPLMKSNLCVRISGSQLGSGDARTAADFAKQAINVCPDNPYGYILLSQAYAEGLRACSGFDRQAGYWLIYDTLSKGRSLMTDGEQAAGIDSQLAGYRASFPSKEECFFRGLNSGDGFTVSCGWVSGRTTVREGR